MTPTEFVEGLDAHCKDSAVDGVLGQFRQPSGRSPSPTLLQLSQWYLGLSESDQSMLRDALQQVSQDCLFGVLCVLDGARKAHDGRDISFRLSVSVDGRSYELMDPSGPDLHDLMTRAL
jgi:hypothetical protein